MISLDRYFINENQVLFYFFYFFLFLFFVLFKEFLGNSRLWRYFFLEDLWNFVLLHFKFPSLTTRDWFFCVVLSKTPSCFCQYRFPVVSAPFFLPWSSGSFLILSGVHICCVCCGLFFHSTHLPLFQPPHTVILNYYSFVRFSVWKYKIHKI